MRRPGIFLTLLIGTATGSALTYTVMKVLSVRAKGQVKAPGIQSVQSVPEFDYQATPTLRPDGTVWLSVNVEDPTTGRPMLIFGRDGFPTGNARAWAYPGTNIYSVASAQAKAKAQGHPPIVLDAYGFPIRPKAGGVALNALGLPIRPKPPTAVKELTLTDFETKK